MKKATQLDLEFKLVESLLGKIHVLMPHSEKAELVSSNLMDVLKLSEFAEFKKIFDNGDKRLAFIKDFLSYGIVTDLLCDLDAEDIIINNLNTIYMHHATKGFIATDRKFGSSKELNLFIKKLLLFAGRKNLSKIMNLELPHLEGRVNIAFSTFGPQITITKAKVNPLSIIDLIRQGSLTHEVAAQFWMYIEGLSIRPANIMIAGGAGCGQNNTAQCLVFVYPRCR